MMLCANDVVPNCEIASIIAFCSALVGNNAC